MKVLTFTPHGEIPDFRGFSVSIVAQNFPLYFSGIQHLHVCNAERSNAGLVDDKTYGKIYRIHESWLYRRLFQKWTKLDPNPIYRRMAVIANVFKPDIIHVHQHEFPVKKFRIWLNHPAKIVVHAHNLRDFDESFGIADKYFAVSQAVGNRLKQTGAPQDRVVVVHNGVDTNIFKPALNEEKLCLRTKYGISKQSRVLLFFGRKEEQKGFDLFLQAVQDCAHEIPKVIAIAVGPTLPNAKNNSSYKMCCSLRKSLAEESILLDLEAVGHQELADLIRLSDIAVLPSREEPQGMAMIEAMASGLVVISTATGGILESIQSGVNGLLLEPSSSSDDLSQLLSDVIRCPEKYQKLGKYASETAAEKFSWESRADLIEKNYCELLEGL